MIRFFRRFPDSERGQALPIVLGLLALGGLTIAVSLNYATTSLKGGEIVEEKMEGVCAAGAGVEYAIWSLKNDLWPVDEDITGETTPENINQMAVNIQSDYKGTFTIRLGGLEVTGDQYYKVSVNGTMTWVEDNRYRYDITVIQDHEHGQNILLESVGVRIPVGFHFEEDSTTRSDQGDIDGYDPANYNPDVTQDDYGADLLNWPWKSWQPTLQPELHGVGSTYIQTFYVTGTGNTEGEYAWVMGQPEAIDIVGEFSGIWYRITATATRPGDGRTTAEIVADVMIRDTGATYINSWDITK